MDAFRTKFVRYIKRKIYGPRVQIVDRPHLLRLGSEYGGWVFAPDDSLVGATILSCGLGEDASFDIEIARLYQAQVVIVDPTPRAITHFNELMLHMGLPSTMAYSKGGYQELKSYDLREISPQQFSLIPVALSDKVGVAKFFSPPNLLDVSHSLVNFQNSYSSNTPYITVPTVDIKTLVSDQNLKDIAIAKFDIEGEEIQVIPLMLANGILPNQILVEYDELNFPSPRGRKNFRAVHRLIQKAGYETVWFDGRSCLSYQLPAS